MTKHHEPFIFSIYARDKKGLIGELMVYFNRKNFPVKGINVARTDLSDLVLITIEACLPVPELLPFSHRLEKIVEIYKINHRPAGAGLPKVGFYCIERTALDDRLWQLIQKYGATVSRLGEKTLVINKTGSDHDLRELYHHLEGPHLLGFCNCALLLPEAVALFEDWNNSL